MGQDPNDMTPTAIDCEIMEIIGRLMTGKEADEDTTRHHVLSINRTRRLVKIPSVRGFHRYLQRN